MSGELFCCVSCDVIGFGDDRDEHAGHDVEFIRPEASEMLIKALAQAQTTGLVPSE